MNKIPVLLAALLCLSATVPVSAADDEVAQSTLKRLFASADEAKVRLRRIATQVSSAEDQIRVISDEISALGVEIRSLQATIKEAEGQLSETQARLEVNRRAQADLFAEGEVRLVMTYKSLSGKQRKQKLAKQSGYQLQVASLYIDRIEAQQTKLLTELGRLLDRDQELQAEVKRTASRLKSSEKELRKEQLHLTEKRTRNEELKVRLGEMRTREEKLISELEGRMLRLEMALQNVSRRLNRSRDGERGDETGELAGLSPACCVPPHEDREPVAVSPSEGRVVYIGVLPGRGMSVVIDHGKRFHSVLSGVKKISVSFGQSLFEGDEVGEVSDQTEFSYELRFKGKPTPFKPYQRERR